MAELGLKDFKVGETVRLTKKRIAENGENHSYAGNLTVVRINSEFVTVRTKSGTTGSFYPYNLERVPGKNLSVLQLARNTAITLSQAKGLVSADDVQSELSKLGYTSKQLGNAAGVLFRGKHWKKIGSVKSTRPGNHLRTISTWQYIGA